MDEPIRILLVDDQPHFADLAKTFLEREDRRFQIDTAIGAAEGLDRLDDGSYDCIVSDLEMPEMTGLELFSEVEARGIDLPFILFTGVDVDDIDDGQFEGITAYLQKGGASALEDLARRIKLTVTAHRRDRDALDIEQRYHALFDHRSFAMAWVECNGADPHIVDHNERFAEAFATNGHDLTGAPVHRVFEAASVTTADIEQAVTSETPHSIDGELVDGDEVSHLQWRIVPVADEATNHALISAHDVTDQASNGRELEIFRTIVEASGDPMYMLDITGEFRYVNDALVELSGRSRDELLGSSGEVVMSTEDYQRGTDLIKRLLRTDRDTGTFEMDLQTPSGESIPCENHVTLIYDIETGDGDEVKGTAGVIRDISERKQRLAELRRYNDRLEELAAFISHDLRNPINIAGGHLKLIEPGDDREHYEAIGRAVARMEELVDDLLMMAKSGQRVLDPEPIDLEHTARLSWSQVSTPAAGLTVETNQTIVGEPSRIKQLLENLFTNAVVHGPPGVTVTVGDLEDGFFVEDDGPGIPEDQQGSVFDFGFTTGEGTGFGLSIVQSVADAHEWALEITEGEKGGARFEFTGVETAKRSNRPSRSSPY